VGVTDQATLEQQSRDAARRAAVDAVAQFLGGVPIDHFVEVTMVTFYQLTQVITPMHGGLNEDTRDSYSGADFHRGYRCRSFAHVAMMSSPGWWTWSTPPAERPGRPPEAERRSESCREHDYPHGSVAG
ncbi:MAG TPA: hypothetical protein VFN75_05005, partial [Pseudonocardiaceae bacterium]|nr:hypothetical protein [Pseudonocardiaceae bacterium]